VCSFQTKFSPFFSPSLFSIRNLKKKKKTKKKPVLLHKPSSETLAQNTAATQTICTLTICRDLRIFKTKKILKKNNQRKINCEGK
jgi:hypothetical protein